MLGRKEQARRRRDTAELRGASNAATAAAERKDGTLGDVGRAVKRMNIHRCGGAMRQAGDLQIFDKTGKLHCSPRAPLAEQQMAESCDFIGWGERVRGGLNAHWWKMGNFCGNIGEYVPPEIVQTVSPSWRTQELAASSYRPITGGKK